MPPEEKLSAKVSDAASDMASDIGSFIRSQRETRAGLGATTRRTSPVSAIRT